VKTNKNIHAVILEAEETNRLYQSINQSINPLWYGMVSHWFSGHFQEYLPFSNLKQHYSAALGLGALLSS